MKKKYIKYINKIETNRKKNNLNWMNILRIAMEHAPEKTKKLLCHPKICVTDIEKKYKTHYTIDTIQKLLIRFPKNKFIWIMGADNLIQIIKWKDWEKIFYKVSINIFIE